MSAQVTTETASSVSAESDTREIPPSQKRTAKEQRRVATSGRPAWDASSASSVLRGIPDVHRDAIAKAYKRRGGRFTTWTYEDWIALEAAIFETENEHEHRGAARGMSDVEPVLGMRKRRVALETLVGEDRPMQVVR